MARRDSDLLAEIERDVLDESRSVASALRKCLTLGGRANSAELREWAARELRGYHGSEESLPDYRQIRAPLLMDGFTGGAVFRGKHVSVIDLPQEAREVIGDELPLTAGVGEIEALIRRAEASGEASKLLPPASAELALMMTHEVGRYQVEQVYWSVSPAVLRGVVDAIRTALTELVAEMRAGMAGEMMRPRRT
jgi:AbiTii